MGLNEPAADCAANSYARPVCKFANTGAVSPICFALTSAHVVMASFQRNERFFWEFYDALVLSGAHAGKLDFIVV